jgi:hypothetical protein
MGRKKKISFQLDPEWIYKEPLDFEYNKYTLLDYLQKCDKSFDKFELYPNFVELSLHLANIQSISKENTLLLTNKKFESPDDEILVKELTPKKPRKLSDKEEDELDKTLKFSGPKLFDAFNIAKSIWNIAFESIDLYLRKNKNNLVAGSGYIFFYRKSEEKLYVWEYEIRPDKKDKSTNRTYLGLISEGGVDEKTLTEIINTNSKWNQTEFYKHLPIFEIKCSQNFPFEETMVPIIKRKVMSYIFQVVNFDKANNFDSTN